MPLGKGKDLCIRGRMDSTCMLLTDPKLQFVLGPLEIKNSTNTAHDSKLQSVLGPLDIIIIILKQHKNCAKYFHGFIIGN